MELFHVRQSNKTLLLAVINTAGAGFGRQETGREVSPAAQSGRGVNVRYAPSALARLGGSRKSLPSGRGSRV
ncbi:MAG: hypothetical protein LH609_02285 [Rudanella sp.]|nr:hypothetical protein [Rudanella sp.]